MSTSHTPTAAAATLTGRATQTPSPHHQGGEPLDVLVIGAGQAGLALAWHLNRCRLRYLVVDAAPSVGHSWRTRWDSLRLFTPSQYDGLPGTPFPAPDDTYPTKDQVADYLHAYAEEHAFPILANTAVTRLTPEAHQFTAHTSQGVLRARQVVVATGAFHRPVVPPLATHLDDDVAQLHSSAYRNPEQLPHGRILVVGGGNSGLQIAEELAATRTVTLAVGTRLPALPQRVAGRDLFWWLTRLGLIDTPADAPLARRIRSRGDLLIGTSSRRVRRCGVDIRPRVTSATGDVVGFKDVSSSVVDAVVWATGYRPDYSWIDAPILGPDHQVLHRGGEGPVPGLWFLGLPWQRNRGSALLGFVQHDAALVARQLSVRAARH